MGTLDIVFLVVIIILTALGGFLGFLNKLKKYAALGLAFALSYYLTSPIDKALYDNGVYNGLIESMNNNAEVVNSFMYIIIFVLLYLVLFLIFAIIFALLIKVIKTSKIVNIIDHILGALLGIFFGLALCGVAFTILEVIAAYNASFNDWLIEDVSNSQFIVKFLKWLMPQIQNNSL